MMIAMILISTKMNEINPEQRSEEIFENFCLFIPRKFWQNLFSNQVNFFAEVINCEAKILDQIDFTLRIPAFYSFVKFLVFAGVLEYFDEPFEEICEFEKVGNSFLNGRVGFVDFSQNLNSQNSNLNTFWSQNNEFSNNFQEKFRSNAISRFSNGEFL